MTRQDRQFRRIFAHSFGLYQLNKRLLGNHHLSLTTRQFVSDRFLLSVVWKDGVKCSAILVYQPDEQNSRSQIIGL